MGDAIEVDAKNCAGDIDVPLCTTSFEQTVKRSSNELQIGDSKDVGPTSAEVWTKGSPSTTVWRYPAGLIREMRPVKAPVNGPNGGGV